MLSTPYLVTELRGDDVAVTVRCARPVRSDGALHQVLVDATRIVRAAASSVHASARWPRAGAELGPAAAGPTPDPDDDDPDDDDDDHEE